MAIVKFMIFILSVSAIIPNIKTWAVDRKWYVIGYYFDERVNLPDLGCWELDILETLWDVFNVKSSFFNFDTFELVNTSAVVEYRYKNYKDYEYYVSIPQADNKSLDLKFAVTFIHGNAFHSYYVNESTKIKNLIYLSSNQVINETQKEGILRSPERQHMLKAPEITFVDQIHCTEASRQPEIQ